jgi:broad specificity phosphatase PhoE
MGGSQGTVILIRHADVTPDPEGQPDPDPSLNAAGCVRARELCHVLRDAGIGAIFVTHFLRSRETAKPLEEKLGIEAKCIDAVVEVVEQIRTLPTSRVALVIGHSDTVPEIIARLGGPSLPILISEEFDNLFVLSGQRLTHLRYGV